MKPLCLECATPLRPEDVNPASDVARCPSCGAVFPARKLLRRYQPFDKRRPPKDSGIELRLDAEGFGEVVLPRGMQHPLKWVIGPFLIIWWAGVFSSLREVLTEPLLLLFPMVFIVAGGCLITYFATRFLFQKQRLAFGDRGLVLRQSRLLSRKERVAEYEAILRVTARAKRPSPWIVASTQWDFYDSRVEQWDGPQLRLRDEIVPFGHGLAFGHARWLAGLVRDLVRAHQKRLGIVVQPPAKRAK
jgi:hypothetical protein